MIQTYQSVFFGAVKESETPEKDLKQLGIDEKYYRLLILMLIWMTVNIRLI